MNPAVKWIGGASLGAALFFVAAFAAGTALEAQGGKAKPALGQTIAADAAIGKALAQGQRGGGMVQTEGKDAHRGGF